MMKKIIAKLTFFFVCFVTLASNAMEQRIMSKQTNRHNHDRRVQLSMRRNSNNPHVTITIPEKDNKKNPHPKECGCSVLFKQCFNAYMQKVINYWTETFEALEEDA